MPRPEIEKAVFALSPGETSGAVKSSQGFHLFLAADRREAKPAQYEKVAANLHQALTRQKIKTALPRVLTALKKKAQIKRFPLR